MVYAVLGDERFFVTWRFWFWVSRSANRVFNRSYITFAYLIVIFLSYVSEIITLSLFTPLGSLRLIVLTYIIVVILVYI